MSPAAFRPAWWLPGGHLQTLWQPLLRQRPHPDTVRESLATPDGDFLDLDWYGPETERIVILLHGLSGSSRSPYIRGMQVALARQGWRSVALNFRGCGGRPNHTWRGYHSGETGDFHHLLTWLRQRRPAAALAAIGYSLGGNVLLKWLGEQGGDAPLLAAAAVSVPLRLDLCATRLDRGLSRLYRDQLLRELKAYVIDKRRYLERTGRTEDAQRLAALGDPGPLRSFWEYDYHIVARLYGFRDARDYYRCSSSRQYLRRIRRPTLLIQSRDDPFMTPAVLPEPDELAPAVRLEVTASGGHVGFVGGTWPWRADYWLERRIPAFLAACLAQGDAG